MLCTRSERSPTQATRSCGDVRCALTGRPPDTGCARKRSSDVDVAVTVVVVVATTQRALSSSLCVNSCSFVRKRRLKRPTPNARKLSVVGATACSERRYKMDRVRCVYELRKVALSSAPATRSWTAACESCARCGRAQTCQTCL